MPPPSTPDTKETAEQRSEAVVRLEELVDAHLGIRTLLEASVCTPYELQTLREVETRIEALVTDLRRTIDAAEGVGSK
jgi:hypothetical protein